MHPIIKPEMWKKTKFGQMLEEQVVSGLARSYTWWAALGAEESMSPAVSVS